MFIVISVKLHLNQRAIYTPHSLQISSQTRWVQMTLEQPKAPKYFNENVPKNKETFFYCFTSISHLVATPFLAQFIGGRLLLGSGFWLKEKSL